MQVNFQANYYKILGLGFDFTKDEIKKNYRVLSKMNHPDKNGGDDKIFKLINEANKILNDEENRLVYDKKSKYGKFYDETIELLDYDFSNESDSYNILKAQKEKFKKNMMLHIMLDIEEFHSPIRYKRNVVCVRCDGSGTSNEGNEKLAKLFGGEEMKCDICEGTGNYNGGDCPGCKGNGYINMGFSKCSDCKGNGTVSKQKEVHIKREDFIDGKMKLDYLGNQSKDGAMGNLYIIINGD